MKHCSDACHCSTSFLAFESYNIQNVSIEITEYFDHYHFQLRQFFSLVKVLHSIKEIAGPLHHLAVIRDRLIWVKIQ